MKTSTLYARLRDRIERNFKSLNMPVEVGLPGLHGADFGSADGNVVGEIKRLEEITDRCMRSSWGYWRNQAKPGRLKYVHALLKNVDTEPLFTRFLVATICGQLATYVLHSFVSEGWLVLESSDVYSENELDRAVRYIKNLEGVDDVDRQTKERLHYLRVKYSVNLGKWASM